MAADPNLLVVVNEFLESSSSSDEDEVLKLLFTAKKHRPKISNYKQVLEEYTDEEFRRHFRLTRRTFIILLESFANAEASKQPHGGYCSTPNDIQLLSFLWFAGNKCVIRDVASRFGIAEFTFHKTSRNIMHFLNDIAPKLIKVPETLEEKQNIAAQFEAISGFPGVIGVIDGTYIPIRTPTHKIKSTYTNRHDQPSLTLQAVCNADKVFLDVFTGLPSKIHDARIYNLSFLSNVISDLCQNDWHLLGDAAYPLRKYLMTPYRDYSNMIPEQSNFNYKLSSVRVKIENAVGLLEQRFRQLQRTEFLSVLTISRFIISCCVLHNLCIFHADIWDEFAEIDLINHHEIHVAEEIEFDARDRAAGAEKRDRICRQFALQQ